MVALAEAKPSAGATQLRSVWCASVGSSSDWLCEFERLWVWIRFWKGIRPEHTSRQLLNYGKCIVKRYRRAIAVSGAERHRHALVSKSTSRKCG